MIFTFGVAVIGVFAWLLSRNTNPSTPTPTPALVVLSVLIVLVLGAALYAGTQARRDEAPQKSSENYSSSPNTNSITNAPHNAGIITQGQTGNNTINIPPPQINIEQDHRPWVYASQTAMIGGIKWKDGNANFDLAVILKNSGYTPALAVEVMCVAYPTWDLTQLLKKQQQFSEAQRHNPSYMGTMVFGEPVTVMCNAVLTRDDITTFQNAIRALEESNHRPPKTMTAIPIGILVIIDYQLPGKKDHHQTGYVINVFFRDPAMPDQPGLALPIERDVPGENLRLEYHMLGQYAY